MKQISVNGSRRHYNRYNSAVAASRLPGAPSQQQQAQQQVPVVAPAPPQLLGSIDPRQQSGSSNISPLNPNMTSNQLMQSRGPFDLISDNNDMLVNASTAPLNNNFVQNNHPGNLLYNNMYLL